MTQERSLRHYAGQFLGDYLSLKGRGWASLRRLLLGPGELEEEALQPVAARGPLFVHPVRLYLAVNLVFFLLVPWFNTEYGTIWSMDSEALALLHSEYPRMQVAQAAELELEMQSYRRWFDAQTTSRQGAFVIVMLPMIGALLWVLLHRKRRFLVDHLLIATSALTVFLLSLIVLGVFARLVLAVVSIGTAGWIMAGGLLLWPLAQTLWFWGALRRFYSLSRLQALIALPFVGVAFLAPFFVYMHVLFWSTWLALRGA